MNTRPIVINTTSSQVKSEDNYSIYPATQWTVLGLSLALILIISLAVTVFLVYFNPPPMHEIFVVNNCSQDINILFGVITSNTIVEFFPIIKLSSGQSRYYQATPGTSILVQGFRNDDTFLVNELNPFTTVDLTLAGEGFSGKYQVTDGTILITDVSTNTNPVDSYGVSMQGGYNIPVTIAAKAFDRTINTGNFVCNGPSWNHDITSSMCPISLQSPGTGTNYQICLAPCTSTHDAEFCCEVPNACTTPGGCEQLWPIPEYYDVFHNACPNCLITNCDRPNYTCRSNGKNLVPYTITFCP